MQFPTHAELEKLDTTSLVLLFEEAYGEGLHDDVTELGRVGAGAAAMGEAPTTRPTIIAELDRMRDVQQAQLAGELELPPPGTQLDEADARAGADLYLGALAEVRALEVANNGEYAMILEAYAERQRDRQAKLRTREAFLLDMLQRFLACIPLRGKAKSVQLLAGRIGRRKRGGRWTIVDEVAALAWARESAPGAVITKTTAHVSVSSLKGSLPVRPGPQKPPPGLEWIPETQAFYADVDPIEQLITEEDGPST